MKPTFRDLVATLLLAAAVKVGGPAFKTHLMVLPDNARARKDHS